MHEGYSDFLVSLSIPLLVLLFAWHLFPDFDLQSFWELFSPVPLLDGPFSLESAYRSYINYGSLASAEVRRMERSYSKLGRADARLSGVIGYPQKLKRLQDVTIQNCRVTEGIAGAAKAQFAKRLEGLWTSHTRVGDLHKVRESLKHYVRDWSNEGKVERDAFFKPILDAINIPTSNGKLKILVPGCGLGRLAWELAERGHNVYALELSFFQTLALRFLLNPDTTSRLNQHHIHPYAYWFSHQKSNTNLFRAVSFPDALPRIQKDKFTLLEEDFLKHSLPWPQSEQNSFWDSSSRSHDGYDYIVTLFFIHTSLNVLSTLHKIHSLLKPGGVWINLGPLLWTGNAQASLELSLEEVLAAAEQIGFVFQENGENKTRTVESEYTTDKEAMMRWIYKAEFWIAQKPA